MRLRRVLAVSIALASTAVPVQTVGGGVDAAPPASPLRWSPCFKQIQASTGASYQCTVVPVPLDYDAPNGPLMDLSLVRIPARDQANKIGSIFLNPGGPGGSGVDFALFFGPSVEFVWGLRSATGSTRRLRSARRRPEHRPAVLRQPAPVDAGVRTVRVPDDARGGSNWSPPATRCSPTSAPAWQQDPRPHVDGQRGPRP